MFHYFYISMCRENSSQELSENIQHIIRTKKINWQINDPVYN